jgi:IclR family pca regulon transcriptional regulator
VLAGGFLQGHQFGKTIQPVMRAFSYRAGETISMAMLDGSDAVYVAHAGGETGMARIGFTIGSRLPLLCEDPCRSRQPRPELSDRQVDGRKHL